MKHVTVTLRGTTPLVMHNIRLADKNDPITKAISAITDKPSSKRTEAENLELEHLEFVGGLYYDAEVGVHLPTFNLLRSFEEAAKITRQGKSIIRALSVTTDRVPVAYEGPRKPEELWAQPEFHFRKSVGVKGTTITRMRPIFRRWGLTAEFVFSEMALDPADLERIVEAAGVVEGIGDARKLGNGRYDTTIAIEDAA